MGPNFLQSVVLYTLSSLAQVCAALIAFLGAIAIFRLQNLTSRRDNMVVRLRELLEHIDGPKALGYTDRQVITRAATCLEEAGPIQYHRSIELALRSFRHRGPEILSAQRLLFGFVFVNVAVIAGAILSFLVVDFWASHPWWAACFLTASVVAVSLFTIAMAFEMVGALDTRLAHFPQLREWLRRTPGERWIRPTLWSLLDRWMPRLRTPHKK